MIHILSSRGPCYIVFIDIVHGTMLFKLLYACLSRCDILELGYAKIVVSGLYISSSLFFGKFLNLALLMAISREAIILIPIGHFDRVNVSQAHI